MQIAKAFAQVIADHAIHHEDAVGIHRRGENFASRQVAPFVAGDDSAGLKPFQLWRKFRFELGAAWCLAGNAVDLTRARDQPLAELINCAKIGAHAFEHDLAVDVHHVPMSDPVMVHYRRHFGACNEFARLSLCRKNRDLRAR